MNKIVGSKIKKHSESMEQWNVDWNDEKEADDKNVDEDANSLSDVKIQISSKYQSQENDTGHKEDPNNICDFHKYTKTAEDVLLECFENPEYKKKLYAANESFLYAQKLNTQSKQNDFLEWPIKDENMQINIHSCLSNLMSEKVIRMDAWSCKNDDGHVYTFPMDIDDCLHVMNEAEKLFETETSVINMNSKVTISVGDIRGEYRDFLRQVQLNLFNPEARFVFKGNYVGIGKRNVEVIILLSLLKILNPLKMIFLRGSHETISENANNGFLEECYRTFGEENGTKFWFAANKMFNEMPLVCCVNECFLFSNCGVSRHMLKGRKSLDLILKKPKTLEEWESFVDIVGLQEKQELSEEEILKILDLLGLQIIFRSGQVLPSGVDFTIGNKLIYDYGSTNLMFNRIATQVTINKNTISYVRFINMDEMEEESEEKTEETENSQNKLNAESGEKCEVGFRSWIPWSSRI